MDVAAAVLLARLSLDGRPAAVAPEGLHHKFVGQTFVLVKSHFSHKASTTLITLVELGRSARFCDVFVLFDDVLVCLSVDFVHRRCSRGLLFPPWRGDRWRRNKVK